MFEPDRTDWNAGKAMFDVDGSRVPSQDAYGFERKTVGIQKGSFFQSFVPNQN